jgi:uncharacterized membrane protein YccC
VNIAAAMTKLDARHGAQLAAAVVASYLCSAAVGLPEGFWAVMSALIVSRPDAGATLGAGWDRIRGTLLGTACGLAGVWLRHAGLGAPAATLAIVAVLAFASAGVPILRSAPITALIILSSGGIAGHSALQVAGLRVAEIAIGVSAGLAISVALPFASASRRFNAECAAVLRSIAEQVRRSLGDTARTEAQRDAASHAMRAALRQLVLLGDSAEQESRLSIRRWLGTLRGRPVDAASSLPPQGRTAKLVMRTSQDAGLLGRAFEAPSTQGEHPRDPFRRDLCEAACAALESVAQALTKTGRPDLAALRRVEAMLAERRADPSAPDDIAWLLAGPVRWLLDDLRALGRIAAATPA